MKKILSIVITFIVISLALVLMIDPKREFSYNENRYLTKKPILSFKSITTGNYMSQLEDYIVDHFPFRETFMGWNSKVLKLLGNYKQKDIYYGNDNKLYQDFTKPKNADVIIKRVNNLSNNIESDTFFMLVPTSIYVNQDKLPKYNITYDEGKAIDYYKKNLNTTFIDVRSTLKKNNSKYLYYGTDHHWTTRGAYYAYLEYCQTMGLQKNDYEYSIVNDSFRGTLYSKVLDNSLKYDVIEKINDETNYRVYYEDDDKETNSLYNEEYLKKKDKYSFYLDNNHSLIKIENKDIDNNNTLLIIKDSYANTFVPLISPHYKYIYVIDPRYYEDNISDFINENRIEKVLFLYNILTIDDDLGIVSIK